LIEEIMKKDKLLNINQAAELLGIKPKTLYQWKWRKQYLPFFKIGKSLRISEKDLMQFIEKRRRVPESDY
jgi:excisionase family DNA binding protein